MSQLTQAMRQEVGEIDRTVLKLCDGGHLTPKCAVYRILDNNTTAADQQYTLVTKAALKQYEPVIAVMGSLRERDSYEAWCDGHRAIAMLHAIDIDNAEMPPSYHGPPLLVDTSHYTNEVRFLRDPRFSHRQVEANVEARLVWHHQAGLPYVVFVTLQALPAGVELWKRWDVESREVAWRVQMKYAAKRSHCQHHYIAQLQAQALKHNLPVIPPDLLRQRDGDTTKAEEEKTSPLSPSDPRPPSTSEYIPFTWRQSESWTLHHVCAHAIQEATVRENRRLRKKRQLLSESKAQVDLEPLVSPSLTASLQREEDEARRPPFDFALLPDDEVAFAASRCRRMTENDWSGISEDVLQQLHVTYRKNERDATRLMEDVKQARRSGVIGKAAIHRVISTTPPCTLLCASLSPVVRSGGHAVDAACGVYRRLHRTRPYAE